MCRSVLSFVSDEYFILVCTLNIGKGFYELLGFLFILKERDDYGVLVESLGGKMLDGQNFDPSCTHLVIGKAKLIPEYFIHQSINVRIALFSKLQSLSFSSFLDHEFKHLHELRVTDPQRYLKLKNLVTYCTLQKQADF